MRIGFPALSKNRVAWLEKTSVKLSSKPGQLMTPEFVPRLEAVCGRVASAGVASASASKRLTTRTSWVRRWAFMRDSFLRCDPGFAPPNCPRASVAARAIPQQDDVLAHRGR